MRQYNLTINNNQYDVTIRSITFESATVEVNGELYHVNINAIKNIIPQTVSQQQLIQKTQTMQHQQQVSQNGNTPDSRTNNLASTHAINNNEQTAQSVQTTHAQPQSIGRAVTAPIPGQIRQLAVNVGDIVSEGQAILVMEAMKMENTIATFYAGRVAQILVNVGDTVGQDQKLVIIE